MAPDPRRVRSEQLSPVNGDILDTLPADENEHSDDQDGTPEGYMLFTGGFDQSFEHYMFSSDATDDDDEDEETNFEDAGVEIFANENTASAEPTEEIEITRDCGSDSKLNTDNRPDIAIDCDKIKQAMVGFTLPPSSIPAWASDISDLDISSHINRILNNDKK